MKRENLEQIEIDKAWDAFENPAELYKLLKEEGNLLAGRFLANKYHLGDEVNGIFINPEKAKEIYKEIGEDFEFWEKEEEEDPNTVEYIIEGTEEGLKAVKVLFDTLNSKYGTPDLFAGVYIPLGVFMQTLVGSPYYEGNVLTLEEANANKLILTAELDKPFALLYALHEAFGNLKFSSEIENRQDKKEPYKECLLSVKDGSMVGPYQSIRGFSEGLAPVKPLDSDKYGFIDLEGNMVIAPQFDDASSFSEGFTRVETKNGRKFYINKKGEKVLEPLFDDFGDFSDGLAWVEKRGKYGFIDKAGKVVIEPQFDQLGDFRDGYAQLGFKDDSVIIDKTGREAIPPEKWFNQEDHYKAKVYTPFEKDGLWGFIDEDDNDKVVMEPFLDEEPFYSFDGIARVSKNDFIGYLKVPSGEWLKEPQFIYGNYSADSDGFIKVTLP